MLAPPLWAQTTSGTVGGVVRDAGSGAPLKAATATLRDTADPAARPLGAIADENGAFRIERVPLGRTYRLEVVFVGFEKHVVDNIRPSESRPAVDVGAIAMRPAAIESGGVEVRGEREQVMVMAGKTVYTVENNPSYTASNVSELLGQIPSVSVDQDGKISLRGTENVTIMMNDRPLTMPVDQRNKFLQSLPANSVKDVEIRTNPGAQFDAKNQGGIINIVTRRTMSDMVGGNVNVGADSREAINGGVGLYFNGSELAASLGGSINRGKNTGTSTSLRLNMLDTIERRDDGAGNSKSTSTSTNGYGQVDYNFTKNDLFSLAFNAYSWSSNFTIYGNHVFGDAAGRPNGRYYDTSAPFGPDGSTGTYASGSALLRHKFDEGHTLKLALDYNSNAYTADNLYRTQYYRANGELDSARSSSRHTVNDQSSATIITTIDYENPLSKAVTISVGGKNERNNSDENTAVSNRNNVTGEYVTDSAQTSHYLPDNSIYALYGNVEWRPIEELSVQAGLRFERAEVSAKYASGATIVSVDYANLFPSGSLSWNITPQHVLGLSYRRSVALPDINALNPTRVKWSDFSEQFGNPNLEPEFTQSIELSYNTFWGMGNMVTISPYYSTTDGTIERSDRIVGGITQSTNENFNGTHSLGAEFSAGLRPFSWLNLRFGGNVYSKTNRGSTIPGDVRSVAFGASGNAMFSADLMEGLTLSMNMFFQNPATVGASQQNGFMFMSAALRQQLFDKKLTISLRANDPFKLQKWGTTYSTDTFRTELSSTWSSRFVGLSVSYMFGTTPRLERHRSEKTETKGGSSGGGAGGDGGQGGGR